MGIELMQAVRKTSDQNELPFNLCSRLRIAKPNVLTHVVAFCCMCSVCLANKSSFFKWHSINFEKEIIFFATSFYIFGSPIRWLFCSFIEQKPNQFSTLFIHIIISEWSFIGMDDDYDDELHLLLLFPQIADYSKTHSNLT